MGNKARRFGKRLLKWTALAALAWVLLTALPVLMLRWFEPLTSAFMLRAIYDNWSDENYRTRYEWVNFEEISPHAAVAVIAAEDQLFAQHMGFDFKSIQKAVEHNERSKRVRGA